MLLEREVLMITIANPEKYVAGLYERLSNENIEVGNGEVIVSNEDERESGSISTQKLFLRNFCKENNIRVYDDYTDDGFSGATFDRPDFNRMIKDIENKKINLIIVKDLSRFGRLSSKISYYLEEFFIEKGVRFIAVTDDMADETEGAAELARNFDTQNGYTTVISTLIYGVQWDAIMRWMQNVPNLTGGKYVQDSTGMGWYSENYQEGNLAHQTGIDGNSNKSNCVKNIYDLAGNVSEWTMESYCTNV